MHVDPLSVLDMLDVNVTNTFSPPLTDALFTKDRQAKQPKSTLTFTGLLNALDGVGSSLGQLFILTTNLRDQLDSALIRNGRVDMQVFFDYANDEQIVQMWKMFYPPISTAAAEDLAEEFCRVLRSKLEGKTIAPCALQHFFVSQRTKTAQEALGNVDSLIEDLKQKEVEESKNKDAAASAKEGKDGKGDKEEKNDDDDDDDDEKSAKGKGKDPSTTVHIHFHGAGAGADFAASNVATTSNASAETGSPSAVITTTTTDTTPTPTTTPLPASNTTTIAGVNNRSITVTITSSSGTPTTKKTTSSTKDQDDKIVAKNDEGRNAEGEVVPPMMAQAIDETKSA